MAVFYLFLWPSNIHCIYVPDFYTQSSLFSLDIEQFASTDQPMKLEIPALHTLTQCKIAK